MLSLSLSVCHSLSLYPFLTKLSFIIKCSQILSYQERKRKDLQRLVYLDLGHSRAIDGTVGNICVLIDRFYSTQKKTLEINPRHPLMKELKARVEVSSL